MGSGRTTIFGQDTVQLPSRSWIYYSPRKGSFYASQSVVLLDCSLDSVTMTVRITQDQAQAIKELCDVIVNQNEVTITQVAQLVGIFVARRGVC